MQQEIDMIRSSKPCTDRTPKGTLILKQTFYRYKYKELTTQGIYLYFYEGIH